MMKKLVTVEFLYQGVINPSENEQGVLFGDKVLVVGSENGAGLYNAVISDSADKVLVNLDVDSVDFLQENPEMLIGLIVS